VVQILGAVLVVVVLPVALMHVLAGKLGSSAMIVGLLWGVLGARSAAPAECCISPRRSR
jgi:hypothetical protein